MSGQSPLWLFERKISLTERSYFSTHVKYKYEPICDISIPDILQLSCASALESSPHNVQSITGEDTVVKNLAAIIIYFTIVFKTEGLQDLGSKTQDIH